MITVLNWCAVCGRWAANQDHDQDPRYAKDHDTSQSWAEAIANLPVV